MDAGDGPIDRPLRFCMITTFYPPHNFGGDGIFVHHLANELARRGHRVEVVHCVDSYRLLAPGKPGAGYDNHPGVTVHPLESRFGSLSPVATHQLGAPVFKAARIRQILERGFDVIHYHNISLVGGPKILEYGRGIKLYTLHDYWLVCPTHVLFRFGRAPCVRPRCLPCVLLHGRPPQWWRYLGLLPNAVQHVDAFISPGRFAGDAHWERGLGIPVVRLSHFVPSVAEDPAPGTPVDEASRSPYFLFVGRLERIKGAHTLLPVFRAFQKAELLLAGTGAEEARLRRMAEGSGNVRFLGHVPPARLRALYRGALAVIVPSVCFEVFPLVILEAFRDRTAVVARSLGGMRELVEESGGGLLYETDAELIGALEQLTANPAHGRALGLRGYEAYRQRWTPDEHVREYLALIHRLGARKGQGPPARRPPPEG
jgi:glycosyltransferase involved in cell wall biosynthesis